MRKLIPNESKLAFGATLASYGQTPCTDECHNYGSMSGCDEECPALLKGNCQNFEDVYEAVNDELDEDDRKELLSLYNAQIQPL